MYILTSYHLLLTTCLPLTTLHKQGEGDLRGDQDLELARLGEELVDEPHELRARVADGRLAPVEDEQRALVPAEV